MSAVAEMGGSKNLGLRVQKKMLGKMTSKKIAKVFIDDTMGELLDNVYKLCKEYKQNKKEADKLIKNIIKITVKIGILYRNEQFNAEEIKIAEAFRRKFRTMIMTFVSFCEVDYTFDKNFMVGALNDCSLLLTQLVVRHLTDKSQGRIDYVFGFFQDGAFMDSLFDPNSPLKPNLSVIVVGLNKLLEEGSI
ncbi:tumor necrosis factor alpha-induced protein 8 [Strongylocentrotus purpuratus]|uniref:Tumor necrosis factor alpha-induced protein 8-like protein n=1 Tax=Strongylocentrotus purpuratus TaxID=7668 RepID=A0A7M7GNH7_STRPU|nr:tumor necrosis factor alpha-induced protein 8 [Strongylocentrotus purpuratus]|eukprot:XP_003723829.1 PREDICTED: tumor necrosis factor alpha-induced protein 8-like [Strongylocentrotus purpuratus]